MITLPRAGLAVLLFLAVLGFCVAVVLLVGLPTDPCLEFNGWHFVRVFPPTAQCG